MLVFLAFEGMFFAGLIGTFLVFRLGSQFWPPVGQPRLPILVTWANTAILLFSSYTMRDALRAMRMGDRDGLTTGLSWTALLGTTFLIVQGSEWLRLIRQPHAVGRDLRGHVLHRDRMSWPPRVGAVILVADRSFWLERHVVFGAPAGGRRALWDVLVLRRCPLARSLRACVPELNLQAIGVTGRL
jgi:hypothetical protein